MKYHQHTSIKHRLDDFPILYGDVLEDTAKVEIRGGVAVLGYLAYDSDCENPMKSCDCEGSIDEGNPGALGLINFGGRHYQAERDLELDEVVARAKPILRELVLSSHLDSFVHWAREIYEAENEAESNDDLVFATEVFDHELDLYRYGTVLPLWLETLWEECKDEAWTLLFEEGALDSPCTIPIRVDDYGSSGVRYYVADIDSANAAWIPDSGALENIKAQAWPDGVKIEWRGAAGSETNPLYAVVVIGKEETVFPKWGDAQRFIDENYPAPKSADLKSAATRYCEGILEELQRWANGETYGVVLSVYNDVSSDPDNPQWEEVDSLHEAVWGYIGSEYAEEELEAGFKRLVEEHIGTLEKA